MTNGQILHILFEGLMIVLIVLGFVYEDKLIAFEENIVNFFRRKK